MATKASSVKTWRVLKDSLKVGNSSRLYGELIPEAGRWEHQIRASYERAEYIEVVYVTQEELDAAVKEYAQRELEATSPASKSPAKKTVVKKTVAKSKKKRIVKKGKSNVGSDGAGGEAPEDDRSTEGSEELAEVSV